ncbi:Rab GDP-dissociation inhibitor (GDI1) [Vairimorpha necatrix]|uniref:Rab GDP dissociation inhibitor n=1 Tax=Vairimorpha necatrix TaxID=6039 RepID=A0AAX4JHQ6_9MICR
MESKHFDFIILGSGFVESTLASILSNNNKSVMIIDRNDVYGAELATLQYKQLEDYFGTNSYDKDLLKFDRDFCIDLTPKLLLADSDVVKLMIKYKIDEALEFVNIPGSFVYKNKLHSVPCNESQSLKTGLVGFWEKYHVMKFFWDVKAYGGNPETYKFQNTMREEFEKYGLSKDVQEFIGHAIALNLDDKYLERHPKETFDKICLYVKSLMSFQSTLKSPYIYPKYGISGIIQGFVRNACIHNAEVMLRAEIKDIDTNTNTIKVVEPVDKKEMCFTADKIISDQSYIQRHSSSYEVIRGICILEGESEITKKAPASQVIFLKSEYKRQNDMFMVILGKEEEATPDNYKVAIISTVKETDNPEKELEPVLSKLGNIKKKFIEVRNVYKTEDLKNIYFTKGVDESTHFESLYEEVREMCNKLGIKLEYN